MLRRVLVAFDFDHTLIDGNSDTCVLRLLPDGTQLPSSIKQLYTDDGWNDYQREVFRYLHSNHVSKEQLLKCVVEVPLVEGMYELLQYLAASKLTATKADAETAVFDVPETDKRAVTIPQHQQLSMSDDAGLDGSAAAAHSVVDEKHPSVSSLQFDAIIISDSNSVTIDHILETRGLQSVFSKVYTNPASFDSSGCLHLSAYHHQDWCNMSQANMCKGHILDEHCHNSAVKFDVIAYVGDGANDFCPTVRLRETDIVFPRRHFSLEKRIAQGRDKVAATVRSWNTGIDIMNALKELLMSAKI